MASSSMAVRLAKYFRTSLSFTPTSSSFVGLRGLSSKFYSTTTGSFGSSENDEIEDDNVDVKNNNNGGGGGGGGGGEEIEEDDFLPEKPELELQSVDPRRGWGFRGVHKAIICGKIGRAPVQKILRNGKTVTIFTVGTGGMYDQRILGSKDLPKPAQWHRIAVHNEMLGAYAVQQLAKNSSVYVEGDIETRVYNDSINGQVKNIPEVCVRRDGRIRLIKSGESVSSISFDELGEGLL